jgi:deoxycytidylate deaminase
MKTKEDHNGRQYKIVASSNEFMQAAAKAREECAGDQLFPVGIVLVKNGEVVARAGNGFNGEREDRHVCPRIVRQSPSGKEYHLCEYCQPDGHAEPMLIEAAREAGIDTEGADVYMYGHWWCCTPCWEVMDEAGIANVYLPKGAEALFENVRDETVQMTLTSAYISGALTGLSEAQCPDFKALYEVVGNVCNSHDCEAHVPHFHTDPDKHADVPADEVRAFDKKHVRASEVVVAEVTIPSHGVGIELEWAREFGIPVVLLSRKGARVSRLVIGSPAVVYHLEYEDVDEIKEKLPRILRQL